MLACILLLYLSAQNCMIYANPLYQTCGAPCQCQRNPWYSLDQTFEPTNVNPYAIAPYSPPNYQNPANNQEYVNKILSDPTIRTILDPNTKLYDINGIEIPRINPENFPSIINNYIIVPPDVFADNKYFIKSGGRPSNSQRRKKSGHKNKAKKNQQIETGMTLPNNSHEKICDDNLKDERNNSISSEDNKKELNECRPKVKAQYKNSNAELDKVSQNGAVIPKEKDKVIRLKIVTQPTNPREEAVVQEFRRKFPGMPEELVRSLLAYLKSKIKNGDISINDQISYIPPNDRNYKHAAIRNDPNSRRKKERKKGRKRKHPKNKQESTNDKNYASTQELITQTLGNVEKSIAFNNDTKDILYNSTKFNEDKPEVLTKNGAIIEATTVNSVPDEDFKSVNPDLMPQSVNEKSQDVIKHQESSTEKSAQVFASEDDKEIEVKENQEKNNENIDQNYKPDTDGHKLHYNYNVDNTRLPELGTEDEVPITLNGLFEDYYPDFRAENRIPVSEEEFLSHSPQSERYHYTTDRAIEMEELSRDRRKYEQSYDKNLNTKLVVNEEKVYEADKYHKILSDVLDRPVPVYKESEEMTFIAPPALETPDFETKNVKELKTYFEEASKHEPIHKYSNVLDKTSVYSDTKNLKYDKEKPVWKKETRGDLETAFAPSKVAKYGQNSDDANVFVIAESYPDYEW